MIIIIRITIICSIQSHQCWKGSFSKGSRPLQSNSHNLSEMHQKDSRYITITTAPPPPLSLSSSSSSSPVFFCYLRSLSWWDSLVGDFFSFCSHNFQLNLLCSIPIITIILNVTITIFLFPFFFIIISVIIIIKMIILRFPGEWLLAPTQTVWSLVTMEMSQLAPTRSSHHIVTISDVRKAIPIYF